MDGGDRVLVAGIGNVFLGDDGFGVEVARRLQSEDLPANVRVADFGIRGVHLAYELMEGYSTAVLIDAVALGEDPGTLYVIEADPDDERPPASVDAHSMDPATVLATVRALGGTLPSRVVVVGCEPASVDEEMALSPPVAGAIDEAVRMVVGLIERLPEPAPPAEEEEVRSTSVEKGR